MKNTISGVRGVFGEDLSLKDVLEFSNNFSSLIESGRCIIGRDTRPTGQMIQDAASAALMRNGVDVFNAGIVPTPVVFRQARSYGAGIVVTSSHNPIQWNGIKFVARGRGINETELRRIIKHQEISASRIGVEEEISPSSLLSSYVQDAKKIIGDDVTGCPKIVIDNGGGAAKRFASELLREIGCDVTIINDTLDGCSRGPDPTSDKLSELVASSLSDNMDIGFAFDLDGDRLVVVKDGVKQTPDVTLGLGVARSLELGYKNFVLSIDTSVAVEKFIKEHGGTSHRSKVGEANVIEMMLKNNAQAGGEGSSGGFVLPEFNYCREGILTSGLIASMLGTAKYEEITSYMDRYQLERTKIQVDSSFHDIVIEDIKSKFSRDYSQVVMLDGIKGIIDEDSWVLVRKSNTEDIIRVSAESDDIDRCKNILKDVTGTVKNSYEKIR